jgi:predicted acylesterase/phospholipase RssA
MEHREMWVRRALFALPLCATLLGACVSGPRNPVTESDRLAAVPIGASGVRYWADAPASTYESAPRAIIQEGQPFIYLALSGGGGGGAYDAGILNGWTESGTRPEFTIVSGVSTGALIAPFAFLGSAYDKVLMQMYASGEAARLIGRPNRLKVIFGAGLFGRERLRRLVDRYVNDDLLAAIAREYQKGRRLLVITTNLDADRAVIWDMGAIAARGGREAFRLFCDVLAASASVPVLFEPQLIDVEANGRRFQEMHVDGTVSAPIYTLPDVILFGGQTIALSAPRPRLYVIVNGRLDPSFEIVPNQVGAIAAHSFATMNRVGTKAVLAETYDVAGRENFSYHLSYIDRDFPNSGGTGFETAAMRRVYDYGNQKARSGAFWVTGTSQADPVKEAQ